MSGHLTSLAPSITGRADGTLVGAMLEAIQGCRAALEALLLGALFFVREKWLFPKVILVAICKTGRDT